MLTAKSTLLYEAPSRSRPRTTRAPRWGPEACVRGPICAIKCLRPVGVHLAGYLAPAVVHCVIKHQILTTKWHGIWFITRRKTTADRGRATSWRDVIVCVQCTQYAKVLSFLFQNAYVGFCTSENLIRRTTFFATWNFSPLLHRGRLHCGGRKKSATAAFMITTHCW